MNQHDPPNLSPWAWGFCPGDPVRIVDGTFAQMTGEVLSHEQAQEGLQAVGMARHRRNTQDVWVLLEIFGRPVPVALLHSQIEHG